MNIPRVLKEQIIKKLEPKKVVVLYGPRQVGKTTLVKEILSELDVDDYMYVTGEDRDVTNWLGSQSLETLKSNIGGKKLLVIDEAQKINGIGLNLKLIVDNIEDIKVIATGSSSFDLSNQIGEPLVGRKYQFVMYPVSQLELKEPEYKSKAKLLGKIIYGSYPEVLTHDNSDDKKKILKEIVDGYLFKDLLEYDEIKKSQKIIDILKLIAFQIGKEVSLNEIGKQVSLDLRTVEKYLDLLEKVFVVKRVYGFSRNLRKEITKNSRFYFLDNGIRNTIINNYNPIDQRDDIGQLWENYLMLERIKYNEYTNNLVDIYFWRTHDQKEIDLVEEKDGKLFGYEFKWGDKKVKAPTDWVINYPNSSFEVINQENYLKFISK